MNYFVTKNEAGYNFEAVEIKPEDIVLNYPLAIAVTFEDCYLNRWDFLKDPGPTCLDEELEKVLAEEAAAKPPIKFREFL